MTRRTLSGWTITLLLGLLPAMGEAAQPELEGVWLSTGQHPDGTDAPGLVQIVRHGPTVLLTWMSPEPMPDTLLLVTSAVGVGIVTDDVLAVSYYGPEFAGVALYRIEENGQRLSGRWAIAGAGGELLVETLTRVADEDPILPSEGPTPPAPARPEVNRHQITWRSEASQSVSDAQIAEQVESRLFDAGLPGVRVTVTDRRVVLTGAVDSLFIRNRAVRQARGVRDVTDVVDALTISLGESDESMARDIAADVSGSPHFTIFDDVSVQVMDGVVTLTGYVTAPEKPREFLDLTARIPGVQQIVNRLEILPMSIMDDDVRYAVASAIYGSSFFAPYAGPRAGPVHVIVRAGHVTLTGVVRSEGERRAAELLAHQAMGVMSVKNQLRVEED